MKMMMMMMMMMAMMVMIMMMMIYFQRIVFEKETGVKELMKMMGLPSWMHWVRSYCLHLL